MKFTVALFAVAAAMLPAMASPVAEPEAQPAELEKRTNNIYVCSGTYVLVTILSRPITSMTDCGHRNWSGQCVSYDPPYNECQPWSALGLSGLGSWGPSEGTETRGNTVGTKR